TVTGSSTFQLVIKVGQQVGQRRFEINNRQQGVDVTYFLLQPAPGHDQLHDRADIILRHNDLALDPRFTHFVNLSRIGQLGGAFDVYLLTGLHFDLVISRRVGNYQIKVVFALQPLSHDVHVQQ